VATLPIPDWFTPLPEAVAWRRVALTLLLAFAAARLCVWLGTPVPWMIGPLLVTSLVSLAGWRAESWVPLRNTGQWVIGTALGLYFTPEVGRLVASLWWAIALAIAWALLMGVGFGAWLRRVHANRIAGLAGAQLGSTTFFAGAIGAASEMTLISERHGARTDLVAAAHSLRLLLVTLTIPFALQAWGVHGLDLSLTGAQTVQPLGLAALAAVTLVGVAVMLRLERANPWFIGALVVSMVLTLSGQAWSAVPGWLTAAAQLVIGVSLGVRFTPAFLHTAPRWLISVALATVLMMGVSAVFGWGLAQVTGLHLATMVLGTAPGGIAEMAITAKVLQLGVPVVTAFQVCRLVAVLVLVEPLYRWRLRPAPA
jgi:membrane AbrB-like protein